VVVSGDEQHSKLLAGTVGTRFGEPLLGEGVAGCAGGVDGVALAALADRPLRAVDLDDPLPFQGPHDSGPRGVGAGEVEQRLIAGRVGGGLQVGQLGPERGDDAGGVGVVMGVDADDGVDLVCQHGHGSFLPRDGAVGSTSAWAEVTAEGIPVTGHAHRADKLLIRPHPVGQAGAGDHEDTSFGGHASPRPGRLRATRDHRQPA